MKEDEEGMLWKEGSSRWMEGGGMEEGGRREGGGKEEGRRREGGGKLHFFGGK